ncbi:MAG TPA: type VI secretion system tip protein TssI/VgrG, partial [Verrucomicrobiae bacterium]
MNPKSSSLVISLMALSLDLVFADPLGTAFTYQGRLASGASLANGRYDLTFSIWNAVTGGGQLGVTITNATVPVSNGLFTVTLDFGGGVFDSNARWLEIGVRTNGVGSFVSLTPRQELAPAPYALYAPNAGAAAQAATLPAGAVTTAMLADGAVTTSKIGPAAVKPSNIDDGGSASYETMLGAARPLGTAEALPFSELSPVTGEPPALVLALDGAALGTAVGFIGREAMSAPYEYVVEVVIPAPELDPAAQLGRQARLTFARNGRSTRFSGLVTACALSSFDGKSALYTFRIEPPLAFLAQTTDYRVYQDRNAPAIVSGFYQNLTTNTLSQSLVQTHAIRPCAIQYGETALNFFNRLLEDEGIFYFFNAAGTALTIADGVHAYLAAPNSPFAYYGNNVAEVSAGTEYIRRFEKATRESTKTTRIAAYDFTRPTLDLSATAQSTAGRGEYYQFGSSANTVATLAGQARLRQERQDAERATVFGLANAPDLRPGYTFELDDRTASGLRGAYVVTSVRHSAFRRMTNGVPTFYYGNQFEVIPSEMVYRPALKTPKPSARACTANVTGPAGEDRAFVDEYGRVKVQFHWDRYGVSDQNSSAWIRVATPMAGASHGMLFLPRVGDEVLVDFLQGDPDQPVVTSSFYNAQNRPPYALPANKELST